MKQRIEQIVDYFEIEKTDKLCPLLSIVEMRQFGYMFYCVGEKCMWWQKCNKIERRE